MNGISLRQLQGAYSNTTFVKVKCKLTKEEKLKILRFKYNIC